MAQAAADRAAIAHRAIGDAVGDARQTRRRRCPAPPILDRGVRDAGADRHRVGVGRDAGTAPAAGASAPAVAAAPGADSASAPATARRPARARPPRCQQRHRLGQARRPRIVEGAAFMRGRAPAARASDALRRDRQLGHLDAERRQRVVDRVGDRGRRPDRAALADALLAERAYRATASPCGRCARPAPRSRRAAGSRRASRRAAGRASSYGISSYSAVPMPCAVPPITWPSTIIGLTSVPPSSHDHVVEDARRRRSRYRPRRPRHARRS